MLSRSSGQRIRDAQRALDAGQSAKARAICDEILSRGKKNPAALYLLGCAYAAETRYDEAVGPLERAARLDQKNPKPQLMLGQVHKERGKYHASLRAYDKVLKLDPRNSLALCGKAEIFERKGNHKKVLGLLGPFLERGTEDGPMALILGPALKKDGRDDEAIALLRRHVNEAATNPQMRRRLNFALGKIHERRGEFNLAFAAYRDANEEIRIEHDAEAYRRRIDELIEVFGANNLDTYPRAGHELDLPVLVVGMPRTGSTLVERIIDAHPMACGAGETLALPGVVRTLPLDIQSTLPYPQCAHDMDEEDVDCAGRKYVGELEKLGRGAARVVDKLLSNYEHLGLISLIAPEARIIDCRRDPMDTCLSCFMEPLVPNVHPYASDLTDLGQRYLRYEHLMDHWRDVLDIRMIQVRYESLVDDPESEAQRIIEFLGLPWDESCLRFHETNRDALTLSREQVRRPLYRSSVNRAERFAGHLDPLREALGLENQGG